MPGYVAFLRAINLGRVRKLPMSELRACLTEAGLEDVETFIQTGNLRFRTRLRSRGRVEEYVEQALAARCGFEVPTVALPPAELRQVYDDATGLVVPGDPADARRYVTLLKQAPTADVAKTIDSWNDAGERARVVGRAVHWMVPGPSQQARMSNARIEKLAGTGTTRDLKVIRTLAERWGS